MVKLNNSAGQGSDRLFLPLKLCLKDIIRNVSSSTSHKKTPSFRPSLQESKKPNLCGSLSHCLLPSLTLSFSLSPSLALRKHLTTDSEIL